MKKRKGSMEKEPSESLEVQLEAKTCVQKPIFNKRNHVTGKRHFCVYCKKAVAQMARHLEDVHAEEQVVAKILALPKKSRDRRVQFSGLLKKGDFHHNRSVLENSKEAVCSMEKEPSESLEVQLEAKICVQKPIFNKRNHVTGKRHFCVYCEKAVAKMARHLKDVHAEEPEVAKILALPKKSRDRRVQFAGLLKKGDFHHNRSVLENSKGIIVPKYRKVTSKSHQELLPCQYCLAFYVRSKLWRHVKTCQQAPGSKSTSTGMRNQVQVNSKMLLPTSSNSKKMYQDVLVYMKKDSIGILAQRDPLIMNYGVRLHEKFGHFLHRHQLSLKMRDLARFLQQLRATCPSLQTMASAIDPQHWDTVIQTVREVSGFDPKTHQYGIPTRATRIRYGLKALARLVLGQATVDGDNVKAEKARDFLTLHRMQWADRIGSNTRTTLQANKGQFSKPLMLSDEEDDSDIAEDTEGSEARRAEMGIVTKQPQILKKDAAPNIFKKHHPSNSQRGREKAHIGALNTTPESPSMCGTIEYEPGLFIFDVKWSSTHLPSFIDQIYGESQSHEFHSEQTETSIPDFLEGSSATIQLQNSHSVSSAHQDGSSGNDNLETPPSEGLQCLLCKRSFSLCRSSNFKTHLIRKHAGTTKMIKGPHNLNIVECLSCKKTFTEYNSLEKHVKNIHVTNWSKWFACKYCSQLFKNLPTVKEHERKVHTVFDCKIVLSTSSETEKQSRPVTLVDMSTMHENVNKLAPTALHWVLGRSNGKQSAGRSDSYLCKYCKRSFELPNELLSHLTVHSRPAGTSTGIERKTKQNVPNILRR